MHQHRPPPGSAERRHPARDGPTRSTTPRRCSCPWLTPAAWPIPAADHPAARACWVGACWVGACWVGACWGWAACRVVACGRCRRATVARGRRRGGLRRAGLRRGARRRADRLGAGPHGLPGLERVGQARHLGAEQLADLGQVSGDAFLLLRQLVDLTLRTGAVPLDLGLGVRQQLLSLGLRLGDDLVGVLLGVADQLPRVLVGFAPGLLRLGAGLGGPLLRGRGPLLGLADQLLGGGLGRRQPLGLLPLRFFAAGGQLDLELGLGLGPLRLALLQDALGLAAHFVSLPLGGGEDLVALPLGGRLELSHLPLGGGAQLGDVPLDRGPLLRDLVVGRGPQLGHFPLGGRGQLVRLAPGPRLDRVGLAFRRRPQLVRLPLGVGPEFARLVLGRGPDLRRVHLGRRVELVGRGPGLLRDLGGLLLGQPEQLLDAGAQTGVGGPFLLTDLPVSVGQFLLQRLNLLAVLAHLAVKLLEVFVDLMRVVTTHHPRELAGGGFLEEVAELGVDFRLHVA